MDKLKCKAALMALDKVIKEHGIVINQDCDGVSIEVFQPGFVGYFFADSVEGGTVENIITDYALSDDPENPDERTTGLPD